MPEDLPTIEPTSLDAGDWRLLDPPDLSFEGFSPEAFAILERLRSDPHVGQYREEKDGIRRHLTGPFRRYRDDLVVNWVLPNRLAYETERNVFSRLLKNDFGAGGCHHHLWLAFPRQGRRRLTDVQLSHSLSPDGLRVGLFVGGYAREFVERSRRRIEAAPEQFLQEVNRLLGASDWAFQFEARRIAGEPRFEEPLDALPEHVLRADALWVRRRFSREDVLARKGQIVLDALEALAVLWPLYVFFAAPEGE